MTFKPGDEVRVVRTAATEARAIADRRGVVLETWGAKGAEFVRVKIGVGNYTLGATSLEADQ